MALFTFEIVFTYTELLITGAPEKPISSMENNASTCPNLCRPTKSVFIFFGSGGNLFM